MLPLISPPGFQILPYECHEADGAVKYSLSGAREYENAVKEALAKGLRPPPPPTTDLPSREEWLSALGSRFAGPEGPAYAVRRADLLGLPTSSLIRDNVSY